MHLSKSLNSDFLDSTIACAPKNNTCEIYVCFRPRTLSASFIILPAGAQFLMRLNSVDYEAKREFSSSRDRRLWQFGFHVDNALGFDMWHAAVGTDGSISTKRSNLLKNPNILCARMVGVACHFVGTSCDFSQKKRGNLRHHNFWYDIEVTIFEIVWEWGWKRKC